jgi:hypothetical protein
MGNEIRVLMSEERALEVLNEIKNKICDVDLDELCGDEAKIENKDEESSKIYKKVVQAIRCGLVEWDETENCMVQKLIHPLKAGQLEADKLYYKNKIKFGDSKDFKTSQSGEVMIQSLANITARATQLIEELQGQDLLIAIGCMGFFDR